MTSWKTVKSVTSIPRYGERALETIALSLRPQERIF